MSRSRSFNASASPPEPRRHSGRTSLARGRWAWREPFLAASALALVLAPAQAEIAAPDCPEAQKICLQADRDGGIDFKAGTAYMEGNVAGVLKQHELKFRSESLKAFRNELGEWTRLELDQLVELEQPGRRATGDHAVIENDTGLAHLNGSVTLSEPFTYAEGENLRLEREPARSVLTGVQGRRVYMKHDGQVPIEDTDSSYAPAQPGQPEGRAAVEQLTPAPPVALPPFAVREPAAPPPGAPSGPAGTVGYLPDTLFVTADEAIYERDLRLAHFTGNVVMHRQEMGWKVWAQKVDLEFAQDQSLAGFNAAGDVRIEQPGRVMLADEAHSRDQLNTILLAGNARATQAGQFDLASDRLEVYTHVQQGLVQSEDRQRPIRLTLDVGAPVPYRLNDAAITKLRVQGLPNVTLTKLSPLRDRQYPNRNDFLAALRGVLAQAEADLYLEAIAESARTPAP